MTAVLPQAAAADSVRQLVSTLKSLADFERAAAALRAGQPASFDGVWGSACALVAAALANESAGPLVVVLPTEREADDLAADFQFFTGREPQVFPPWETAPDERLVHDETLGQRLRVLKGLLRGGAGAWGLGAGGPEVGGQKSEVGGRRSGALGTFMKARRGENEPAVELSTQYSVPDSDDNKASGGDPRPQKLNPAAVVTSIEALLQPSPTASALASATRTLKKGQQLDIDELLRWLVNGGFHGTSAVELPGEFAHRGGIVDIFAPDWERPIRIELFGDEIDSLRSFDVATQRSHETLESIEVTVLGGEAATGEGATAGKAGHFTDYLPAGSWLLLVDPERLTAEGQSYLQRVEQPADFHSVTSVLAECSRFAVATTAEIQAGTAGVHCHLPFESVERFSGDIGRVRDELDTIAHGDEVFIISPTQAEVERLHEILAGTKLAAAGRLHFPIGTLSAGFRLRTDRVPGSRFQVPSSSATCNLEPGACNVQPGTWNLSGVLVLTAGELFHRGELRRLPRRRLGKAIDSFLDLREGDLVVHLAHGIGRYRGLRLIERHGQKEEHLEIEFDGGTKIYVPAVKIDLVQKYVGGTKTRPSLAKVGGKTWLKQKQAAEGAVLDMAVEMLEMQALRAARPGIAFNPDSEWQREFDSSFPYQETPDQLAAIASIKTDMFRARPMDRLLCGDVGFGKTEVAMRAAFKAVDSGFQVAVLVPTTILAEQHFHSFCERLAEFPFDIAKLSRFCTPEEERETLKGLKSGRVDIVIGTHRLASKDIEFHNLGVVIIDEEQRFGVEVKDRLKALRTMVDVLTLSATPIPRTLHMSLVGLRDISNLETPPEDRLAVETKVTRWDDGLIRHALHRELARGGQVYFVHNRVSDIEIIAHRIRDMVPDVRVRVGHAQMADDELEQVMIDFVSHQFDVLVSTTIVESGLDIPNANTIFIDEADRYGLADLHQLRGRVGRYKNRAYCYLLVEPHKHLTPNATRRLRAIEEFDELGAGFAIAMRDLEIRGAGNLLGTQQSGHIAAVGYELYCQLLENAVRTLQKQPPKVRLEVDINLPGDAFLPDDYVPDLRLKIDLYRRLTRVSRFDELDDFRTELVDRFGEPPRCVERLLDLAALKMDAAVWRISSIYVEGEFVVLKYDDRKRIEQLVRQQKGKLRLVDERSVYLPLPANLDDKDRIWQIVKSVLRPVAATSSMPARPVRAR
jgi:transcription-repair coupling factor (superfamily II helicase)